MYILKYFEGCFGAYCKMVWSMIWLLVNPGNRLKTSVPKKDGSQNYRYGLHSIYYHHQIIKFHPFSPTLTLHMSQCISRHFGA